MKYFLLLFYINLIYFYNELNIVLLDDNLYEILNLIRIYHKIEENNNNYE